ncbi:MAG: hypothetical protein QOC73_1163, partial [Actinomycetota bacterium]|nr:hypothetical protein [Actinomycetota bacterium]
LPLQATTTRPPGTSKTIFPVDGLGVGDGDEDELLERELIAQPGHAVDEFGRVRRATTDNREFHACGS